MSASQMRTVLIVLFAISPALASEFHLFLAFSSEPTCIMTLIHRVEEQVHMSEGRNQLIARHFDAPVPEVRFTFDCFRNESDFATTTWRVKWVSHQNNTFYFNQNGIFLIGHYFCPEDRCQIDTARSDYQTKVDRWSIGLVCIGFLFFLHRILVLF